MPPKKESIVSRKRQEQSTFYSFLNNVGKYVPSFSSFIPARVFKSGPSFRDVYRDRDGKLEKAFEEMMRLEN